MAQATAPFLDSTWEIVGGKLTLNLNEKTKSFGGKIFPVTSR